MRLGLFGGTFDPPHIGHLIVAQDALAALAVERIVFIPAALPPHKRDREVTPAALRLAMLRAATAGNPHFEVDPLELEREGPSYTVDTLRAWARRQPDARLVLIMGADQYAELDGWKEPEAVRRLAEIAVLARGDETAAGPATVVGVRRIDVSSTEIRARVGEGRSIRYLVPPAVEALIREQALYGPPQVGPAPQGGGRTEDRPESFQNATESW